MANPIDKNHLPAELAAQILEREAQLSAHPLSDAIREMLELMGEECAETIQRCTKILRFGLTVNPYNGEHNRDLLEREIGDVFAIAWLLDYYGVIRGFQVNEHQRAKLRALRLNDGRVRHVKVPEVG